MEKQNTSNNVMELEISTSHVESLKEYISSLKQVIKNDEEDIINVTRMANIFLNDGQFENYGYLMERNHETQMRIETCLECIRECETSIAEQNI